MREVAGYGMWVVIYNRIGRNKSKGVARMLNEVIKNITCTKCQCSSYTVRYAEFVESQSKRRSNKLSRGGRAGKIHGEDSATGEGMRKRRARGNSENV